MSKEQILKKVTQFYLASGDFNGIPVLRLEKELDLDREYLLESLSTLIDEGMVSVLFGDIHPNPHIRAFPDQPAEEQKAKLLASKLRYACAYPLRKHLETVVDCSQYEGEPFTLDLAFGSPQLAFKSFDLLVLEDYRNDPRYYYRTNDISGTIGVHDEYFQSDQMAGRDQILLQTFGFCYDSDMNRAIAVFLRYLANLSPEHQRIWKAREVTGDYRLHPDYYRTSIQGEFQEKLSIFTAFLQELQVINSMSEAMGREPLFRDDFSQNTPRRFGFLVRPTLKEFNAFVRLLDKMISENINRDFFQKEVSYTFEENQRDGKVRVRNKGTLTILGEWLDKYFRTDDPQPIIDMMEAFKEVRSNRSRDVHTIDKDVFDQKYFHEQRELMIRAYVGLRTLRLLLANHPKARDVEVDSYLQEGLIWTR